MANTTFYIKKGDTYPNMLVQLLDENNTPVSLTGCTILCRISVKGDGNALIERTATILTQTGADIGKCYHDWQTGDTAATGNYRVEWKVTFPSGKIATFPRGKTTQFDTLVIQGVVD